MTEETKDSVKDARDALADANKNLETALKKAFSFDAGTLEREKALEAVYECQRVASEAADAKKAAVLASDGDALQKALAAAIADPALAEPGTAEHLVAVTAVLSAKELVDDHAGALKDHDTRAAAA